MNKRHLFLLAFVVSFFQLGAQQGRGDDILARTQDAKKVLADSLHQRTVVAYEEDQLDSALVYGRQAIALRESLFGAEPNLDLGKSHYGVGNIYLEREEFRNALPHLRRARIIYAGLDSIESSRELGAAMDLARAYTGIGDFQRAESILSEVVDATMGTEPETYFYALFDRGNVHLSQGTFTAAVVDFRTAKRHYQPYLESASAEDRPYYDYDLSLNDLSLATALTEVDSFELAEDLYRAVIPKFVDWEDGNLPISLNNLANNYLQSGQVAAARPLLDRALRVATNRRNRAITYDHYGEYFLATGDFEQAESNFRKACEELWPAARKNGSINRLPPPESLGDATNLTDLFVFLGDRARAMDSLIARGHDYADVQLSVYYVASSLTDLLRKNHNGEVTRLFWRGKVLPLYAAAIARCYAMEDAETAWYFFEKSKAVLLAEALVGTDALQYLPDSLRRLKSTLEHTARSADGFDDKLIASTRVDSLQRQLLANYPIYRNLTTTASLQSAKAFSRSQLKERTLVHYFFGPDEVYALVMKDAAPRIVALGNRDSLLRLTDALQAFFTSSSEIINAPGAYAGTALRVYQALLVPLELPAGEPLLIVPDGPLTYLPLTALLTDLPADNNFGNWPYLLHRHPISYAYSADVLTKTTTDPNAGASNITAFAPFAAGGGPTGYPRLDLSQDELTALTDRFAVDLLTNSAATLTRFREQAENSQILHLSTHAFSSPEAKAPHLAFYDTLLYLQDLYVMEVPADLVVLSACQTNVGRLAAGEGVLGLGRGFVQAGTAGVVASLWNVNARSTGLLMTDFYSALADGTTIDRALHAAQVARLTDPDARDAEKNPYYWAAFTYYGPATSLSLTQKSLDLGWWLGLVFVGLVAGGLYYRYGWRKGGP